MPILILLTSVWLAACTVPAAQRSEAPSASAAAPATDSLVGVVRVVGSAPVNVRVVLSGAAGSTTLEGPLLAELRQLAGAEVVVRGARSAGGFTVHDYRARSVDGRPVVQGTVEGRSGPYALLRTPDGALIHLVSPPESFRAGQKVWVQGPEAVVVQSYSTLRP